MNCRRRNDEKSIQQRLQSAAGSNDQNDRRRFRVEGPLDCPICNDGIEMAGEDCAECGYVSCKIHGCVECQRLEKLRPLPPDPSIAEAEAWAKSEREEKQWREEVEDAPYGVITPSLQLRAEQTYDYAQDDFNFDAARDRNR